MAKRILMNSKSLKTSFPHIYKIFFLKCPLVISAPGNFFWTGEYASLFGGFSIKQNLPLRVYVGLEPSNTFSIGPIKSLLPFQQVFKSWKFPPLMEKKIASLLRKKAREEKIKINFKIRMIFELPPGCGLSVSSAYALALACALFLASGKISPQEINRWRHSNSKELNKDQRFLKIFHLALELEKIAAPESATGSGIMCSLKASPYPQHK
jgi:galactokinase